MWYSASACQSATITASICSRAAVIISTATCSQAAVIVSTDTTDPRPKFAEVGASLRAECLRFKPTRGGVARADGLSKASAASNLNLLLCGLSGAPSFKPPDWSGAILVLAMVLVVPLFMLVPEMGARLLRPNETRREKVVSRATGRTGLAGHSTTSPSE